MRGEGAAVKKTIVPVLLLAVIIGGAAPARAHAMPMFWAWTEGGGTSPAVAALLSLTPVPVAFGEFYAGSWGAGLAFSFLEVAELATAGAVLVYEGGAMMYGGVPLPGWSATGQVVFLSAVGSFVLTKFIDAFAAASAAQDRGRRASDTRLGMVVRDGGVGVELALRL
jgi:hypothetical protein